MYTRLDLQKRLITAFNVILCVILLVFALVILQQARKNEAYDAWVAHTQDVLRLAEQVASGLSNVETAYYGYFLTGASSFIEPVKGYRARVNDGLEQLEKKVASEPEQLEQIRAFHEKFRHYIDLKEAQIALYRPQESPPLATRDIEHSKQLMDTLKADLDVFTMLSLHRLNKRIEQRKQEQFYHIAAIVIGATAAIASLVLANIAIILLLSASARTARRLHDVEESYRVILENTEDGVYEYNAVTGTMAYSDSYLARLGYPADEMPKDFHELFRKLVHPEDCGFALRRAEQYFTRQRPRYETGYRMRHKDGYWLWILDRAVGTWDEQGRLLRLIGIQTDITKQKKQEDALRELNTELESFTYVASHDLRAPLVNLKGFAREIENAIDTLRHCCKPQMNAEEAGAVGRALHEDIPEALGFINASVERMDKLTNAILNLSRIGRRVYKPVWINMNDLVQRCLKNLKYETNEGNIRITVSPLQAVYADELAMEQIISNILENAIKYLVPERQGEIRIFSLEGKNEIVYAVRDNGRGIQEKDREKVFDIFQRAKNASDVNGEGMGLAFVKAAVRKVGGTIWFESKLDEYTTFYIAMPRLKGDGNDA